MARVEKPTWVDCPHHCDFDGKIHSLNMMCSACEGYKQTPVEKDSSYSDRAFAFMSDILREEALRLKKVV